MDTLEKLRYMADQIAKNFAALGYQPAVTSTAEHIRKYWDPRMKAKIFADDRARLSDIAGAAIELLASGAKPITPHADSHFNKVNEVGHSDAG